MVQLSADSQINTEIYHNTNIIQINSEEGNGADLKGMMDFNTDIIRKRISKGYTDTIYKIKSIMELTRNMDSDNAISKLNLLDSIKAIFNR